MTVSSSLPGVDAELVEVAVGSYKNLREVRVPWGPRMVLYGVNGSGKTNLLEAVALACGSRATMWQLAKRAIQPAGGSISLLVRASPRLLPIPPDRLPLEDHTSPDDLDPLSEAGRVAADCGFWGLLGIERGESWSQAMWSGAMDHRLAEVLSQAGQRPLIRHTLESVTGLDGAASQDRGVSVRQDEVIDEDDKQFSRRLSRVLAMEGPPPEWLADQADDLPDAFAPLRSWLAMPETSRSTYPDLVSLPATDRPPVQMVWMASERTSDEAWFDLASEVWQAAVKSRRLFEHLADLPVWSKPWVAEGKELYQEDLDVRAGAWLTERAASAASDVLAGTLPDFGIYTEGSWGGDLAIYSSDVADIHLADAGCLERLSSGERAAVDAALAHAAAEVERQGALSLWRGTVLDRMSGHDLLEAGVEAERQHVEATHMSDLSSHDGRALDAVIERLDRRLIGIDDYLEDPYRVKEAIEQTDDPRVPGVLRYMSARAVFSPAVREVREAPVRLTAYDEPERHLHPAAQRTMAASLDGVRSDHVVVATHSHLFLGRPGWAHVHLAKTPEGVVLDEFDTTDLDQAATITAEMGLTRGELLSFVRYVLIVEGPVDRLVLDTLYGDLLSEAGVLMLPLHGIDEINSLAELTIVGELLDVGVGILADHARGHHLDADHLPGDATKEERALIDLKRQMARRGRQIDLFGLKRVDVIAYLDEATVADRLPGFPGWTEIERRSRGGTSFKDAFREATGRPATHKLVRQLAEAMVGEGRPAPGDLPHVVQRIVSQVGRIEK